jgi:CRP-like cAMP-binding protein
MATSSSVLQALTVHPFLEGFTPAQVEALAGLAFEVSFEPDQIIFREFDVSSFFYLILSGNIALEVTAPGRTLRIQTIGEGEELGWSSLLARVNKQFQARSVEPVRALAFDGARLSAMCESDPAFGMLMMRRILDIVAERLQATRLQLIDMYSKKGASSK